MRNRRKISYTIRMCKEKCRFLAHCLYLRV
nr:MAG TPA: hypothetical protein [Caudoviricetes sp.]